MKGALREALQRARVDKVPVALVTQLEGGAQNLVYSSDQSNAEISLGSSQLEEIRDMLRVARSGMLPGDEFFVRSYVPPYRLLIVGAVHIAQALSVMAAQCDYQVTVIDPRRAFATAERFQGVELCAEWPDEAMARLLPDAQTAVVTLAHDPKIDDPALIAALGSGAFYIGALGSRRTHGKRLERLTDLGLEDQLQRINAPIGLKLGGRGHAEIAVSILAQLIQARYGG
ncbi:MAG: XdhC family protein [Halieaceae bacterium]|jgi:xanthine dehydrogenase accessory factor|nr:XdhC family protein [Halieaceae bacterium]